MISPLRKLCHLIGMAAVVGDALLNLTLIWPLAERGLAWSTALSAVVQGSCLAWLIQRRVGRLDWPRLRSTAMRTLIATGVMAGACLMTKALLPFDGSRLQQIGALAGPVVVGGLTYLMAARLLSLSELTWILSGKSSGASTELPDEADIP